MNDEARMTNDECRKSIARDSSFGHSSFVISPRPPRLGGPTGFTIVEMLVAITITLVMMAAVVTLFANVSGSVRNRRATVEMSGQLRGVRNVLQQDLQGATCPGTTWQRPESNHGYIELIEGQYREGNASNLIDGKPNATAPIPTNWPPTPANPEIDHLASNIPSSNLPFPDPSWATDGGGLGDADDILMLTVRNEHEPFVGRVPNVHDDRKRLLPFRDWRSDTASSPLAEVVWFAIENPGFNGDPAHDPTSNAFFGEPGMRTIYRRTLLVAPWVNPYAAVADDSGMFRETTGGGNFKSEPGLVRILPEGISIPLAISAMIAFQDRYDLSVRLEWDHNIERWKIMANTLGDLTKRENRFGHYGFRMAQGGGSGSRYFPYPIVSLGSRYQEKTADVGFVPDPEVGGASAAQAFAHIQEQTGSVVSYSVPSANYSPTASSNTMFQARPFAFVNATPTNGMPATANAILNDAGQVVHVVHGPVPLWGTRRGEDVMMTGALAFDVRVYDPGAPLFRHTLTDTVLEPSDQGWRGDPSTVGAYLHPDNMGSGAIGTDSAAFPYVGQGAYVDMGYGYDPRWIAKPQFDYPVYHANLGSPIPPWFFLPRALSDVFGNQLAPGFTVYDTWSFHYENNGVNEDNDEVEGGDWQINNGNAVGTPSIDEGTNGFEDFGHYANATPPPLTLPAIRLGPDDVGERETAPPYDKPLRGVQVIMRVYEPDSRAIRQVRVNQHFMPE
jgi:type II secretory pathway pseudopilin PulG